MATPTAEGSAACAASATWLCGVMAGLADTEMLFARSPWVGFVLIAAIGGFVGWCILLERGDFDTDRRIIVFRRLVTRVLIGGSVGGATSLIWYAYDGESKGLLMLVAALIAVFPLEAYKGILQRFRSVLREVLK